MLKCSSAKVLKRLSDNNMFDDQSTKPAGGQAPGNLPIAEPEDIFSATESEEIPRAKNPDEDAMAPIGVLDTAEKRPPVVSALEAGILRPKTPSRSADEGMFSGAAAESELEATPRAAGDNWQAAPQMPQEIYQLKGPVLSRGIIAIIIGFTVLVIVAGGGWWIYSSFVKPSNGGELFDAAASQPSANEAGQFAAPKPSEPIGTVPSETEPVVESSNLSREVIDNSVLFGEPLDTDDDQLDDDLEKTIGTNPNNWDTDNDGLSDGDEALVWQTDPLNPDTDGDSFHDGAEIKAGYSPTGAGKLFVPPTSTP